jgi:hypothetical protein
MGGVELFSDSNHKFIIYYKLKIRKFTETVTSCDDKMNIDAKLKENREQDVAT